MRKIIILIALTLCITASYGQEKKPVPPAKADTVYALVGKMADFQLLYKALAVPDDVTPNQVKGIIQWLQTIRAIPQTQPADKPKEKPKE